MNDNRRHQGSIPHFKVTNGRCILLACGLLAITLLSTASTSNATLIATDHFIVENPYNAALGQYEATQFRRSNINGAGQDPTIAGFTGPWVGNVTSGSGAVAQWVPTEGAIFTDLPYAEGDRARFAGVDNLQRRVQRELAPYAPSNTYYMSFVSQVLTGDTDLDGFVGLGFTNVSGTAATTDALMVGGSDLRGLLVGASARDGVTNYVVRHVGSTGALQDDIILSDIQQNVPGTTTPYVRHTIVKLDYNDDPGNPNGNSQITVWQDPTDLTSESDASASITPLVFRTFALSSNVDITHLTMTGIDYSRSASWDEPRLATTWGSVTSVPEPTTVMLALIGASVLCRLRRNIA